jgi:hypothetical protein
MALSLLAACTQSPPKELCGRFNSAIDKNIFAVALSEAEGYVDKSAMQQSARAQENSNLLAEIMINVQLQAQNQCAPRAMPVEPSSYSKDAAACYLAKMERNAASYGNDDGRKSATVKKEAEACDFSKWRAH